MHAETQNIQITTGQSGNVRIGDDTAPELENERQRLQKNRNEERDKRFKDKQLERERVALQKANERAAVIAARSQKYM